MSKKRSKQTITAYIMTAVLALVLVAIALFVALRSQDQDDRGECKTFYSIGEHCTGDYLNMDAGEARLKAEENGLLPQPSRIDGVEQIVLDVRGNNIFFEVEHDIITRAFFEF